MFDEIGLGLLMVALICAILAVFGSIVNPAIGFACFVSALINGALSCAALGE